MKTLRDYTPSQISALPAGAELDALCAEGMGVTPLVGRPSDRGLCWIKDDCRITVLWHPSSPQGGQDMLRLLEAAAARGWNWQLDNDGPSPNLEQYAAFIYRDPDNGTDYARGETTQLAVARAFALAARAEMEGE